MCICTCLFFCLSACIDTMGQGGSVPPASLLGCDTVTGEVDPDILKDHSAFFFMVKHSTVQQYSITSKKTCSCNNTAVKISSLKLSMSVSRFPAICNIHLIILKFSNNQSIF